MCQYMPYGTALYQGNNSGVKITNFFFCSGTHLIRLSDPAALFARVSHCAGWSCLDTIPDLLHAGIDIQICLVCMAARMYSHSEVPLTWHSLYVCNEEELVGLPDEQLPSSQEWRLVPVVLSSSSLPFVSPSFSGHEAYELVVQWSCCGNSAGNQEIPTPVLV